MKHRGKTVLAVEESDDPGTAKKAKVDDPSKEVPRCILPTTSLNSGRMRLMRWK